MTGTKRNLFGAALLGLIALACWAYALVASGGLARQYTGISVRLTQAPVTRKSLENAQKQADDGELTCAAACRESE